MPPCGEPNVKSNEFCEKSKVDFSSWGSVAPHCRDWAKFEQNHIDALKKYL